MVASAPPPLKVLNQKHLAMVSTVHNIANVDITGMGSFQGKFKDQLKEELDEFAKKVANALFT
eukprot:1668291-Lingulodinium_polyedra.AAC.1